MFLGFLCLIVFSGCSVSKSDIKLSPAEPPPHPELRKMQSDSLDDKNGILDFNGSKKYTKNGIQIVLLKGSAYEMGYARGVLLREEVRQWAVDCIYMIQNMFFAPDVVLNRFYSRAEKIKPFIPDVYKQELKGLSAGSGIAYKTILMLNVLDTIGKQYACTSVAASNQAGDMIRSRSLDYQDLEYLKPSMLFIYKPDYGHGFASVATPGSINVLTAINDQGLTFGVHEIVGAEPGWKGVPAGLLYRSVMEKAGTVDEAAEILENAPRCIPQMAMVSDKSRAAVFEFDDQQLEKIQMKDAYLVLTNHARALDIGRLWNNSMKREMEAKGFLNQFENRMSAEKLIELHRKPLISKRRDNKGNTENIHSAVFNSNTLDFWIAVDPPRASMGKWVGFNLGCELDQKDCKPDLAVVSPQ